RRRARTKGQGVRGVGLDLDRVGAALGRHLDGGERGLELAPVVGRELGDDQDPGLVSDDAISDLEVLHDAGSMTRRVYHAQKSTATAARPLSRWSTRLPRWAVDPG